MKWQGRECELWFLLCVGKLTCWVRLKSSYVVALDRQCTRNQLLLRYHCLIWCRVVQSQMSRFQRPQPQYRSGGSWCPTAAVRPTPLDSRSWCAYCSIASSLSPPKIQRPLADNFLRDPNFLQPVHRPNSWKENSEIAYHCQDIGVKPRNKNLFFRVRRILFAKKVTFCGALYVLRKGTSSG